MRKYRKNNDLVQSYTSTETEADEETGTEAYTTVTENHFGTAYTSVSREKSVSYTAGTNTAEYSYQTTGTDEDEKVSADSVKYNDNTVISSAYTYDDNGNILSKSYGESNVFTNTYDDKDRITSTSYAGKTYNYTYDTDSQLTGVTGNNYSASYAYDSRGNITSKTVNDTVTSFTYANSGWKDQLISVNGTELTYDANGNVLTYGDREYSWTNGRSLAQITDGDNTYSYTYDESGIRTSKTVNGVTTYYNTKDGVILSQTDGTNTMYFQYDTNGVPLGFICNGVQYFYLTNQMGDVLAITDTAGTIVGNYEYDAWGTVTVADTEIAQQNPIRYRGYYYDSETGYYYLQSRYYDSSICRFINADIPEISQISKDIPVGTNYFAYCNNNPINNSDITGELSVMASLIIGAIVGLILLYVVDIITNLIYKRTWYKRVSSYSDYISAAISGALSMISIKKFSNLITASISSITYICNCIESGKKFNLLSLIVIILIDLAFGVFAGKGVNLSNKVGVIKTSKNKLKTLVSPSKIEMYKKKIVTAKKDIIIRSIRNSFSAITSKLQERIREYFGNKVSSKFIKKLVLAGL